MMTRGDGGRGADGGWNEFDARSVAYEREGVRMREGDTGSVTSKRGSRGGGRCLKGGQRRRQGGGVGAGAGAATCF
jgi:hypothetical protein